MARDGSCGGCGADVDPTDLCCVDCAEAHDDAVREEALSCEWHFDKDKSDKDKKVLWARFLGLLIVIQETNWIDSSRYGVYEEDSGRLLAIGGAAHGSWLRSDAVMAATNVFLKKLLLKSSFSSSGTFGEVPAIDISAVTERK